LQIPSFANTRISASRKLSDYSKVRRFITRLMRNNRFLHPTVEPGSFINLGCGPNIRAGFVNIDADWVPGLDICCDITRGLPFPDGSVGGIFSEHCLEHLSLEDGRALLRECWRVLAPKSLIRIIVPDLELYVRAYAKHLDGASVVFPNEYFANRSNVSLPVALMNELFYGSGHRFIYDFHALSGLLGEARFHEIEKHSFGAGSDERLLIDSPGRRSESLYAEARKP
jgi:predicted SAM-dependent methyltransferase